jgi:radical SAM/Cys-rich protein
MMSWSTIKAVLSATAQLSPVLIDITGGAPELHPSLEKLLIQLVKQHHRVQVRTNLTVLLEPEQRHLPTVFQNLGIELVASLPCYLEENVCQQRGEGVFTKSIEALQFLNKIGYGIKPELPLTLMYNPLEPVLPPEQSALEHSYHQELGGRYGIQFTRLHTLTNMPIGRFLEGLKEQKPNYVALLKNSFNPQTLDALMCRHQINIGWDGKLYDCDFNLALGIPVSRKVPQHIKHFNPVMLSTREIMTGEHCFGCTAGSGSSCGGSLV